MGLDKFRDKKDKDSEYVNTSIVAHENSKVVKGDSYSCQDGFFKSYYCPACEMKLSIKSSKVMCLYCGNKIDWPKTENLKAFNRAIDKLSNR